MNQQGRNNSTLSEADVPPHFVKPLRAALLEGKNTLVALSKANASLKKLKTALDQGHVPQSMCVKATLSVPKTDVDRSNALDEEIAALERKMQDVTLEDRTKHVDDLKNQMKAVWPKLLQTVKAEEELLAASDPTETLLNALPENRFTLLADLFNIHLTSITLDCAHKAEAEANKLREKAERQELAARQAEQLTAEEKVQRLVREEMKKIQEASNSSPRSKSPNGGGRKAKTKDKDTSKGKEPLRARSPKRQVNWKDENNASKRRRPSPSPQRGGRGGRATRRGPQQRGRGGRRNRGDAGRSSRPASTD